MTILLTALACLSIGFAIGVLVEGAFDFLFHVDRWLDRMFGLLP